MDWSSPELEHGDDVRGSNDNDGHDCMWSDLTLSLFLRYFVSILILAVLFPPAFFEAWTSPLVSCPAATSLSTVLFSIKHSTRTTSFTSSVSYLSIISHQISSLIYCLARPSRAGGHSHYSLIHCILLLSIIMFLSYLK